MVQHIYYESKTVNNVTTYEVDLLPEEVPSFFRSGMNATIDFVENSREGILLIPAEAVVKENGQDFVLVKQAEGGEPEMRAVKLGISDDKNTEVISGLDADDAVILKTKKYVLPTNNSTGTNPFMPARRQSGQRH